MYYIEKSRMKQSRVWNRAPFWAAGRSLARPRPQCWRRRLRGVGVCVARKRLPPRVAQWPSWLPGWPSVRLPGAGPPVTVLYWVMAPRRFGRGAALWGGVLCQRRGPGVLPGGEQVSRHTTVLRGSERNHTHAAFTTVYGYRSLLLSGTVINLLRA